MERKEAPIEYTKLGNTGMDVSRICIGCMGFGDAERWTHKWVLNEENSRPIIKKALDDWVERYPREKLSKSGPYSYKASVYTNLGL